MEMEIETASIDKNQTVYIFTLIYIPWLVTETHCVLPIPIYGLLIHLPLTELLVLLPLTDSLIFFHILGTPRRTVRAGLVLPPANFIAHLAGLGGRWGRDISPEEGMSSLMYPQVSCGPPTLLITILLLKSLFILPIITPLLHFQPSSLPLGVHGLHDTQRAEGLTVEVPAHSCVLVRTAAGKAVSVNFMLLCCFLQYSALIQCYFSSNYLSSHLGMHESNFSISTLHWIA